LLPTDLTSFLICLFLQGVVRGRVMWPLIFAVYLSMLDFQKGILADMGFGVLLCVLPFWTDSALLQALKDLWDRRWNAFVLPWGHMTPHLEDVARITGLRVHGDPVTGQTLGDYREMARDLLGYEDDTSGPLMSLKGSALTDKLGAKGLKKNREEGVGEYTRTVRAALAGRWTQEGGEKAQQELRVFLLFFLSRLLFATKSSSISLRFLSLLVDLRAVGNYAWGAAVLADLFLNLSTPGQDTGLSGFSPLIQVCSFDFCSSFGPAHI